MPANLTPQYYKAEEAYKRAHTAEEKLAALRQMLATIPKHKGTEKLQADIKSRIKKLKEELQEERKKGKRGVSFRVPREGAGQVVLLGPPNVGKSRLLAALTSARPEVAPYPFTTHRPQPGMMPWQNVAVQLVDLPPITASYLEGWVPGLIHAADAAVLVADLSSDDVLDSLDECLNRLQRARIFLCTDPAKAAELAGQSDGTLFPKKCLLAANKLDAPEATDRLELLREAYGDRFEILPVSAEMGEGLGTLRDRIYQFLNVIRVYSKPPGKPVDRDKPFTLPAGSTVMDLAEHIHRELAAKLKSARVWGEGVYPGQPVKRTHVLHDGDVVELHF